MIRFAESIPAALFTATVFVSAAQGMVFSNALFPSPWHPEHGTRRVGVGL